MKEIKGKVLDAGADPQRAAVLQELERGSSLLVQRDNLAVDHAGFAFEIRHCGNHLGILRRERPFVARPELRLPGFCNGESAEAVILDLQEPVGALDCLRRERLHGFDVCGR